jgi:GAF domain-containing protein
VQSNNLAGRSVVHCEARFRVSKVSSHLLIQLVRQQLERDLLERVREAERAYRGALAESKQITHYSRTLTRSHPDTASAMRSIADSERSSLERYDRLLGSFTELVVNERPSLAVLLKTLLDTAIDIVGADKGAILVSDSRPGPLRCEAQRGLERQFLDFFVKDYNGATVCGLAFQTSRRVIVEDITESPMFAGTPCLKVMLDAGLRAVQSTPLVGRDGHTLGILSTHYSKATHLTPRDLAMLDRVSSQAALFIEAYDSH